MGVSIFEYIDSPLQDVCKSLITRALNGESVAAEIKYKLKKNKHYLEMSLNPIIHGGEILGVSIFSIDITEKRLVNNLLQEKQQMLQSIMDNTSSVIYIKDVEGRYILVNKQFERVNKILNAEIKGKTDYSFLTKEIAEKVIEADKKVIENQSFLEFEEVIPHEDGMHTYLASKFPLFDNNNIYAIGGIASDITSRKVAEQSVLESSARMNALLENSIDAIWSIDTKLTLTSFNNSYLENTKMFYDIEPYIGMPILEHLSEESRQIWNKLYTQALSGKNFTEEVADNTTGAELFFDISFNPILINDQITGVAVFARDVTNRKNVEKQLEYKVNELNTFMYKATHDLRSPLVSIMGLAQLAEDQPMNEELASYCDMINTSVRKMDNLLIDLVKIVGVAQGKLAKEEIDFEKIIDDVLTTLAHRPGFSEIIFRRQMHLESIFLSDRKLVYSILQNLIDNAIKYRRLENQTESIIIITVEASEEQIRIGVTDNGMGIPDGIQDKIFDMFYRGTTASEGSGLGLYIVKTSVEKLGGKITVNSIVGKGTSMNIVFPR